MELENDTDLKKVFHLLSASTSDANSQISHDLFPNIVVLACYIFIGILGNGLVIHIYLNKMKETTDSRFFIPTLAAADIFACVVSGACAIYLHFHNLNFTNEYSCKVIWYTMTATSSGAAMILVFIAVHRYFKICKIYGHIKLMEKKITILVAIYLVSFVISSPVLVTSGISETTYTNKTFSRCERISHDYHYGTKFHFSIGYTVFESLVVISIATVMTVLYVKVGLKLYYHFKMAGRTLSVAQPLNVIKETNGDSNASADSNLSDVNHAPKASNSSSESSSRKKKIFRTESSKIQDKKDKFNRKHKYTYIFIAISVVCIVTYTPRMTLMVIETVDEFFWLSLYDNSHLHAFLKFLNRTYIVNNIANPFLYAMFDAKFKKQLLYLFTCKKPD